MERGANGRRRLAPGVRGAWRVPAIAATLTVSAITAFALPGLSTARPAAAGSHSSSLPTITAHKGKAFVPILGDWDGTVDGFPASFQLRYDPSLPQRAGTPQYGLMHVAVLRPNACPSSSAHYGEAVVDGQTASEIGTWGSLGLSRFGLGGGFTGRRSATLSGRFSLPSCSGQLIWNMHPASRPQVDDGTWNVKFSGGATGKFTVLAGGRIATSIGIPTTLTACNGLQGAVDVFIAPNGTAKISNSVLSLTIQFSRRTATGKLNPSGSGCAGGPIRFTASQKQG
jgi:hypothetical protein